MIESRNVDTLIVEEEWDCPFYLKLTGTYNLSVCTMRENHECVGLKVEGCPFQFADVLIKVKPDA